jgi:hypothetical protein
LVSPAEVVGIKKPAVIYTEIQLRLPGQRVAMAGGASGQGYIVEFNQCDRERRT